MTEVVNNCVRDMRTKAEKTQEEVALAVGVSRQTIIAIEKGNYVPSVLLAMKLADFFNVTVEQIFSCKK